MELCPYCSFTRVTYDRDIAPDYYKALKEEIRLYHAMGYRFDEVYVGGGTPTIDAEKLIEVISLITSLWRINSISVETNPDFLGQGKLYELKKVGVNRLSVGVQTFNNGLLKRLNRYEKYGAGSVIIERLKRAKGVFNTLNIDMMFTLPGQTVEILGEDLTILQKIQPDQVTFYPLMGDSSHTRSRDLRRFYKIIFDTLTHRYDPVSAWCFAIRDGMIDEYIVTRDEYVGVGAGAFSYLNGRLSVNSCSLPGYIDNITTGRPPQIGEKFFTEEERIRYSFLMHLFKGIFSFDQLEHRYGTGLRRSLWKELAALRLTASLKREGRTFRLTKRGYYYLVIMMKAFFTQVNDIREFCRNNS
jgi:coproporphyrinogen III oxidase-like Fe-S oxidoreductase